MSFNHRQVGDILSKIGQFLLADDMSDIGKFDRLHHWQYGFVMAMLGEFVKLGDKIIGFVTPKREVLPPPPPKLPFDGGPHVAPPPTSTPISHRKTLLPPKPKYGLERLP